MLRPRPGENRDVASKGSLYRYEATLDRAGLALTAGGLVGGVFATVLVLIGSGAAPLELLAGFLVGAVITAMAAVAIGGPVWLLCHAFGQRGPWMAILVGALAGFALFLGGQTYGFGLFAMPVTDSETLLFRWISAVATSLILALVSALIGWTMWRVAYRRVA